MAWQRVLTTQEIMGILEEDDDVFQHADHIDAVYIPPTVDNFTDVEDADDDAMGGYDNMQFGLFSHNLSILSSMER